MINDNILTLINKTPQSIRLSVAAKIKARRLDRNWTQNYLATKAGMPLTTYRKFEREGEISFRCLVNIAFALELEDDFDSIFSTRTYKSIDEMLNADKNKQRKRGTENG